jgi:hypothetical protein
MFPVSFADELYIIEKTPATSIKISWDFAYLVNV